MLGELEYFLILFSELVLCYQVFDLATEFGKW